MLQTQMVQEDQVEEEQGNLDLLMDQEELEHQIKVMLVALDIIVLPTFGVVLVVEVLEALVIMVDLTMKVVLEVEPWQWVEMESILKF